MVLERRSAQDGLAALLFYGAGAVTPWLFYHNVHLNAKGKGSE
jgi:hypothetical protein